MIASGLRSAFPTRRQRGRPRRGCAHISMLAEEAAMFSHRIRSVMERKKLLTAPPETTVTQAAKLMAKKNVGAVMVVENELLVGIFTERDALFRVIAQGRDTQTTLLADVMTA